jgi:hypothetical protein
MGKEKVQSNYHRKTLWLPDLHHSKLAVPMVGFMVEPKTPPAFRLLFADVLDNCANRKRVTPTLSSSSVCLVC